MLLTGTSRRRFLAALAAAPAAGARPESPAQPLFDGRSLAGWSVREGPESAYYVEDGAICGSPTAEYPAWLRSETQHENFDFQCEFFLKGWCDGGVLFHAPEHGPRTSAGFKISLFHQVDKAPVRNSMGSIFPLIAPRIVNVRGSGEWNTLRTRMDWPRLQVWVNGEQVHDVDVESSSELRYRLRAGYIGFESLSYPLRFRNISIRELPSKLDWEVLYEKPSDIGKWTITESSAKDPARFLTLGHVLRGDGLGNLTTKEKYRDFALQMYIRGVRHHNGGVLFRRQEGKKHYEIQLHDVEEAHYPTGSLYFHERARYPRLEPEQWFLFQLFVKDRWCLVRINGENVMEFDRLEILDPGSIELQAHQSGRWIEYKHVVVRRL